MIHHCFEEMCCYVPYVMLCLRYPNINRFSHLIVPYSFVAVVVAPNKQHKVLKKKIHHHPRFQKKKIIATASLAPESPVTRRPSTFLVNSLLARAEWIMVGSNR
jgi:hypothetical protein